MIREKYKDTIEATLRSGKWSFASVQDLIPDIKQFENNLSYKTLQGAFGKHCQSVLEIAIKC